VADRRFQVTRIDELERIPLEGKQWRPIRRALGVSGFGINAYTAAEAGDEVIEPHDETSAGAGGHEELYLVVSGTAEFTIEGERVEAPAGTVILIPVAAHRVATATEPETTVLVIGGVPGSLPVSPFEYWYAAQAPYSRGDYDEAVAVASEGLTDYPEHPTLHYQLACYNALAGHRDEALEHLRTAEAGNPQVLEWANGDPDLDSIRDDPRYPG
jgi:mannose-6-phosphate isomerase-like protein (cupin superfamily)